MSVDPGSNVEPPTTKVGVTPAGGVVTAPGPAGCRVVVPGPGFAPIPVAMKQPTSVHLVVVPSAGFPLLFGGGEFGC